MVVWWLLTKVTGLVHIEKTQLISESYNPPTASGKDMENEPRTKGKRVGVKADQGPSILVSFRSGNACKTCVHIGTFLVANSNGA